MASMDSYSKAEAGITVLEATRAQPRRIDKTELFCEKPPSCRLIRVGYEVIRVPLHQTGHASGEYEDFLTGFVLPNGEVWGRPVGVTVAQDGSLLVTDDRSNSIWRVSYTGQ